MASTKKILITTESHEMLILRLGSSKRAFGFCKQCEIEVEILTVDQAVSASGIGTKELMGRIDLEEVHAIETESGHILVCAASLPEKRIGKSGI